MQADALSRFAQDLMHDREDNQQLRVLGPQHFESVAAAHYKPASTDTLGDRIYMSQHCSLLFLIFYFECHMTVGYFT